MLSNSSRVGKGGEISMGPSCDCRWVIALAVEEGKGGGLKGTSRRGKLDTRQKVTQNRKQKPQ